MRRKKGTATAMTLVRRLANWVLDQPHYLESLSTFSHTTATGTRKAHLARPSSSAGVNHLLLRSPQASKPSHLPSPSRLQASTLPPPVTHPTRQTMVGLTKRKVQAGRRDSEGGGRTERSLGQSAEDLQKKLYRHYNETSHLNAQWRHSLTRVSLALSAILVFRLYKLWGEKFAETSFFSSSALFPFLQANLVEALGVLSGLLIAHYIRTPLPLTGGIYVLPWSFYAALLLAMVEVGVFYQHVSSNPAYVLHIDATLPVGALFFIFVWGADLMMGRSQQRARQGLEASQRLGHTVAPRQTKVE